MPICFLHRSLPFSKDAMPPLQHSNRKCNVLGIVEVSVSVWTRWLAMNCFLLDKERLPQQLVALSGSCKLQFFSLVTPTCTPPLSTSGCCGDYWGATLKNLLPWRRCKKLIVLVHCPLRLVLRSPWVLEAVLLAACLPEPVLLTVSPLPTCSLCPPDALRSACKYG